MWEDDLTLSALSTRSENNMAAVHEYEQSAGAGDAEVYVPRSARGRVHAAGASTVSQPVHAYNNVHAYHT